MKIDSSWGSLAYWQCGEWQTVREKLADEVTSKRPYCPGRSLLFSSLDHVPFGQVRCVLVGQDPYPNPDHCTGIAFSVPGDLGKEVLPPTLKNIFKEYQADLQYPAPKNGDLTPWCDQGVLLWNAYPSCQVGKPGSHHWDEWTYLTKEIMEKLSAEKNGLVFVFLGRAAGKFSHFVDCRTVSTGDAASDGATARHICIETSHPSPLGASHGFLGSRIFSRINSSLVQLGQTTINWRLEDGNAGV